MEEKKTITGVLIDPLNSVAELRTVEKSLESYYGLLGCTCIDIVSRGIDGERFDIICDDEALLQDDNVVSVLDDRGDPMLFGPVFVVKFDGEEDVTSITPQEGERILTHVRDGVIVHDGAWGFIRTLNGVSY